MGTRARLNLYLAITFVVAFCISSAALYRSLIDGAMNQVRRDSMLQMDMALAVRQYTIEEVRPLLPPYTGTFHPPAIPAYAPTARWACCSRPIRSRAIRRWRSIRPMRPIGRPAGSST